MGDNVILPLDTGFSSIIHDNSSMGFVLSLQLVLFDQMFSGLLSPQLVTAVHVQTRMPQSTSECWGFFVSCGVIVLCEPS